MKLNALGLAGSSALAIAAIWTLCSLMVMVFPSAMAEVTGHMIHAELKDFQWTLTFSGYLVALVAWSAWAAVTGWLIAIFYNLFVAD